VENIITGGGGVSNEYDRSMRETKRHKEENALKGDFSQ
jgi:hypothetical protein